MGFKIPSVVSIAGSDSGWGGHSGRFENHRGVGAVRPNRDHGAYRPKHSGSFGRA